MDTNVVESGLWRSFWRLTVGIYFGISQAGFGEDAIDETELVGNDREEASDTSLSPEPGTWAEYFANLIPVSDEFMDIIKNMEDPFPEERDFFKEWE